MTRSGPYDRPGIYDGMPMPLYIGDPCPEPSLSTGVICELLERSPLHAWQCHPRLGGGVDDPTPRSELGQAVHSVLLGGAELEFVETVTKRSGKDKGMHFVPEDWATADAKEARDAIRARGNIPMLPHQRAQIEAVLQSATSALASYGPGRPEQTMLWREENGVWCRGRADWLTDDGRYDIDLKTSENAEPGKWIGTTLFSGYDIQAALRARGHYALTGRNRDVIFLVVEIEPPYACSFVGIDPSVQASADAEIERAIALWADCLRAKKWPGYDGRIHYAELPSRVEYARELRNARRTA